MKLVESIKILNEESENLVEDAVVLMCMVERYVPNALKHPEGATDEDRQRYNSLVRSHVFDKRLVDKLLVD